MSRCVYCMYFQKLFTLRRERAGTRRERPPEMMTAEEFEREAANVIARALQACDAEVRELTAGVERVERAWADLRACESPISALVCAQLDAALEQTEERFRMRVRA